MAVEFAPEAKVGRSANGGYVVAPENVIIKPELNGRYEDTDVSELAEDIRSRGQILPAICSKSYEGFPVLVAGHRRYRAIHLLNKDIKDADKRYKLKFNYVQVPNDEAALDITVAENRNRTDVNPMDDAYNIKVYVDKFGKSVEEIALKYFPGGTSGEAIKKNTKWVKDRLSLLKLSDEAQSSVRSGSIKTTAATKLAELPQVAQDKLVAAAKNKGTRVKVEDVKAAKAVSTGKKPNIADNSPVKRLKKFQKLADTASTLASEVIASQPDPETVKDLAKQVAVYCHLLGVPLEAKLDKWAADNVDYELDTPFEDEE